MDFHNFCCWHVIRKLGIVRFDKISKLEISFSCSCLCPLLAVSVLYFEKKVREYSKIRQHQIPCTCISFFLFVAVLEGIWSTWSPWSGCNQDCVKHRRRTCNADTLSLETICPGDERDMASCSGDFCYSKQKFIFLYLQANYFKDPYFFEKK